MSYSRTIKAPTKADAKTAVSAAWDEIVKQQPVHAHDRPAAEGAAHLFVDLMPDDASRDVVVEINGSCAVAGSGYEHASATVKASMATRGTPAAQAVDAKAKDE